MTKDEKVLASNRRSLGPNPRPIMRMPDVPPYFKADPNAAKFWKQHEASLWEWVKNLELDMNKQIQAAVSQAATAAAAAAAQTVINEVSTGDQITQNITNVMEDEAAFHLLQINGF